LVSGSWCLSEVFWWFSSPASSSRQSSETDLFTSTNCFDMVTLCH
jgi:hypothetical protein